MKTKSFAMLAVTGLLTASIAYVVPAIADEAGNELPMEQTLADNSSTPPADNSSAGSSMQPPADNSMQGGQSGATSQGDMNGNVGGSSPNLPNQNSNEEGTPDTTTGDDDY